MRVRIVATHMWSFCGWPGRSLTGRYCPDRDVLAADRTRRGGRSGRWGDEITLKALREQDRGHLRVSGEVLSTASENWLWHSFRELSGVSGGASIAAL